MIELLIVVVIIGIIAAIGYPQYNRYILQAGRSEGAGALMELMERQEHFYRDNLTYSTDLTALGYAA
ncbi:MAG: type IV pilin protein, partial [Pseudomonadota bacterium]